MDPPATGQDSSAEDLQRQLEEKDAEIQRLQEQLAQANDQTLRAMADMENVRRRSRQEQEESARYGTQNLLQDLLPAIDNLERALSVPNATKESLLEGVQLTMRQLHDILQRHGVEVVPGQGEPFDAQHHEAIMRADPTEEFPAGTVVDEIRKGYKLRGRLLRPSLVKVAQDE
jgi:molecular chaperone GrpE